MRSEALWTNRVEAAAKAPVASEPVDPLAAFRNKIICADAVDAMRKLPDACVDLVVTSPPYNLRNSTGNGMKDGRGGKWERAALKNGYSHHSDCMPHGDYVAWQRAALAEMMRLIPDSGAIFYNHKWRVQGGLLQDRSDILAGFPVRQIIIWRRKGGINFNPGYFLPTYEVIYMICKDDFKLKPKANALGDVWEIPQENNNPHPAPLPIKLAQRCIQSTNAEIVLDPFIGSGTTAIAAEICGRKWIGLEIAKEYCKVANERIEAYRRMLLFKEVAMPAWTDEDIIIAMEFYYTCPERMHTDSHAMCRELAKMLGKSPGALDTIIRNIKFV